MPKVVRFNRYGKAGMKPPFQLWVDPLSWAVQSINAAGATRWN